MGVIKGAVLGLAIVGVSVASGGPQPATEAQRGSRFCKIDRSLGAFRPTSQAWANRVFNTAARTWMARDTRRITEVFPGGPATLRSGVYTSRMSAITAGLRSYRATYSVRRSDRNVVCVRVLA